MQSRDFFAELVALMETLRGPEGCPWDQEQTRESLKPMLIEEAFEVLHALDAEDPAELCEELGDLLFQVIFHSQIASERGEFDIHDVCREITLKMIRRHPHVFGEDRFETSEELLRNWEQIKANEKAEAGRSHHRDSMLDGIPPRLPAIYRAHQMTAKASRVGFDWTDLEGLRDKLVEEMDELIRAREAGSPARTREETGDLLFTALNVARFAGIDPETALRVANEKFERRFRRMEAHFAERGLALKDVEPEAMEAVWNECKQNETPVGG